MLRPIGLLLLHGREMSSSLLDMGRRPDVADWGGGMSASCTVGPVVSEHEQWMAAQRATVTLAHAEPSRHFPHYRA